MTEQRDDGWAANELADALIVARDTNRLATVGELRERVGMGDGDVRRVLNALRESGEAVEEAPDMWRAPYEGDGVSTPGSSSGAATVADVRDERDAPSHPVVMEGVRAQTAWPPAVVMPAPVLAVMDNETVGAIVKAGVEDAARRGAPFVLEVRGDES